MSNNFKIGDKVKVIKLISEIEFKPWFAVEEVEVSIDDILEVKDVNDISGWILLKGLMFSHAPDKFKLIRRKKMKKSDLRTGMQVEYRSGERRLVLLNTVEGDRLVKPNGILHAYLNEFNDDLTYSRNKEMDIVKVYQGQVHTCHREEADEIHCIWEREVKLEVTVKVNGKIVDPKEISVQTWRNLRSKL